MTELWRCACVCVLFIQLTSALLISFVLVLQWQPFVAEFCGDLRLLRFFLGEDALVPPGLVATSHGLFLFPDYRLNPNRTLLANLLDLDIVMRSSVNSSLGIQADGWLLGAKNETELEEIAANAWDYDLTVLAGMSSS